MRKTDCAGKTASTIAFSSRALFRSWPNGFSITTRRHGRGPAAVPPGSDSPERLSCWITSGNGLRRDGQVERAVAAGAALRVQVGHGLRQLVERVVVGELAGHEPDALAAPAARLSSRNGVRECSFTAS